MTNIDYSQYYYRRDEKKPKKEPAAPKKTKKRGSRRFFKRLLTFILVIAVLGCIFTGIDHATDGKATETVLSFVTGKKKAEYYLLVSHQPTREKAYAQSLLVRQGGAGGYVYSEDKQFYVVYSAYKDEDAAKAVAGKNKDTAVVRKTFWVEDKRVFDLTVKSVNQLIESSEKFENGEIHTTDLLNIYASVRAEVITLKQTLYEEKKEYTVLNLLLGGLDDSALTGTKAEALASIRYTLGSVILSAGSAEKS